MGLDPLEGSKNVVHVEPGFMRIEVAHFIMIECVKMAEEEEASFLQPDFHLFMCSLKVESSYEGSMAML